jgi:hypothetical protein
MKALLLTALTLAGLPLLAQTSTTSSTTTTTTAPTTAPSAQTPPSPGSMMSQVMSVLSPAEKDQLMAARQKAMTDNPNLQTEEMDLMQKGMSLQAGTATDADKDAFRTEIKAHADKVRAAMIAADPTITPVLQKVEAEAAKLRAEYQSQAH